MNNESKSVENPEPTESRGVKTGHVTGTGIIIGENIKVGDISINVYETAQNYGLALLPATYFKDNQQTDSDFKSWKRGFRLKLPSVLKGLEFRREHILKDIKYFFQININILVQS